MNADRSRAFPEWEFAKPLQQETIYMNTYDKIITAKNPRPDSAPLYAPPKPSKTRADDFGGVGEDRPKPRAFIATSTNKADFTGGKYDNLVPSVSTLLLLVLLEKMLSNVARCLCPHMESGHAVAASTLAYPSDVSPAANLWSIESWQLQTVLCYFYDESSGSVGSLPMP